MLTDIHPKLPMRNKSATRRYYSDLGFRDYGNADYEGYLMLERDGLEIHFFEFKNLNPKENYGQIYMRTNTIEILYQPFVDKKLRIHPNGKLETKPWGQKEFSMLDPDHNLLTFGESISINSGKRG